jgi:hypothetical protein
MAMRIENFSFGSIDIDGRTYSQDVVLDRGKVRKRRKAASKRYRDSYGHTPLSIKEEIPWGCRRLVIGTGAAGALPVMDAVKAEANRRKVELVLTPTKRAIDILSSEADDTNAILHLTC